MPRFVRKYELHVRGTETYTHPHTCTHTYTRIHMHTHAHMHACTHNRTHIHPFRDERKVRALHT